MLIINKNYVRVFLTVLFFFTTVNAFATAQQKELHKATSIQFLLPGFNKINVTDAISVTIKVGAKQSIVAQGTAKALRNLVAKVKNGTLYLYMRASYLAMPHLSGQAHSINFQGPQTLHVTIHVPSLVKITQSGNGQMLVNHLDNSVLAIINKDSANLIVNGHNIALHSINQLGRNKIVVNGVNTHSLRIVSQYGGDITVKGPRIALHELNYSGDGVISIEHLVASPFNMHIDGNPKLYLRGFINVHNLVVMGDTHLDMYWLKSPDISIYASDHSQLKVAGNTDVLHMQLEDYAHVDARFLRARQAFIRTNDHASADVLALDSLFAFAAGKSNIYYYEVPNFTVPMLRTAGSVLNMGEIPGSLLHFNLLSSQPRRASYISLWDAIESHLTQHVNKLNLFFCHLFGSGTSTSTLRRQCGYLAQANKSSYKSNFNSAIKSTS